MVLQYRQVDLKKLSSRLGTELASIFSRAMNNSNDYF